MSENRGPERGVALIIVLLVMLTLSALAMALTLLTSTETRVAAAYRDGLEVLYATDAAVERAIRDLAMETRYRQRPLRPDHVVVHRRPSRFPDVSGRHFRRPAQSDSHGELRKGPVQ